MIWGNNLVLSSSLCNCAAQPCRAFSLSNDKNPLHSQNETRKSLHWNEKLRHLGYISFPKVFVMLLKQKETCHLPKTPPKRNESTCVSSGALPPSFVHRIIVHHISPTSHAKQPSFWPNGIIFHQPRIP